MGIWHYLSVRRWRIIRQLKTSLITVLILLFSLVTTTYAWLSLATVNSISNIELNAVNSYELELSLDGVNYYEKIPSDLILARLNNLRFADLTSQDGLVFTKLLEEDKKVPVANQDYLSLTFYFRTTNRRYTEIHLTNHKKNVNFNESVEGTYITSRGQTFKNDVAFNFSEDELIAANTVRKYYASEAMRVSFNSNSLDSPKIFDLSNDPLRGFGYKYGARDYYYQKQGILLEAPEGPAVITKMSTFSNIYPIAETFDSFLVSLKLNEETTYYEGIINVNIWLEGWDGDAFDAIFKDLINIQFEFMAVMPNHLFE